MPGMFDPRGFDQAPGFRGPVAQTGTVYNPSGAAGQAAVGQPFATNRIGNGDVFGTPPRSQNPAHYTNRPAGMTSGQWNQQYNSTLPGGSSAGGGLGSYQSGITNGSVSNQTISNAMRNFGFNQAPGVPYSPEAFGQINQQYGDAMNQGLGTAAIDFARNAAFQQAQMDLARQRARSDSGIGFGNLLARMHELNLNTQNAEQGQMQNLLMGLVG